MKTLIALAFVGRLLAEDQTAAGQKHLTLAPLNGGRPVKLSANSIERDAHYPGVVVLKGNIEIQAPSCLALGKKRALVCEEAMIVRADEAEFHEDTGAIEAHGKVSFTPAPLHTREWAAARGK